MEQSPATMMKHDEAQGLRIEYIFKIQ